ncbi:hypothetical protein LCGC14_1203400 [marine sediment metagenome]|uniref:PARP-type domain-containing protein n=1 Tax=marine sediment metagenome TaxID=412755 RepID=A0A0F9PKY2_9ZZZZ
MPPSVRVRVTAKATTGPCEQCPEDIPEGERYVTVVMTFGQSKAGKTKYKAVRVHFVCLAKWLICDDLRYSTRKKEKGGRPEGSGLQLNEEGKKKRRHLIRTRARLLRLILATPDWEDSGMDRIRKLVGRIEAIQPQIKELGGPINDNLNRRASEVRKALDAKIKRSASYVV